MLKKLVRNRENCLLSTSSSKQEEITKVLSTKLKSGIKSITARRVKEVVWIYFPKTSCRMNGATDDHCRVVSMMQETQTILM